MRGREVDLLFLQGVAQTQTQTDITSHSCCSERRGWQRVCECVCVCVCVCVFVCVHAARRKPVRNILKYKCQASIRKRFLGEQRLSFHIKSHFLGAFGNCFSQVINQIWHREDQTGCKKKKKEKKLVIAEIEERFYCLPLCFRLS